MRPLVIEARLHGRGEQLLFRLDSGTNVPVIYDPRDPIQSSIPQNSRILKRFVEGMEQDFAVLQPQDLALGADTIRQVVFVHTIL